MHLSWDQFKARASEDLSSDGAYIYRGQRDAGWRLKTSLHRTALVQSIQDLKSYADFVLPHVHEAVEAWVGRGWTLTDPLGLAEFLAFLQHNGFPTPLLDWTYSPYVAAYFAFESVNHFEPQTDRVAIYVLNQQAWGSAHDQVYDFADTSAHVSVLRPRIVGNHKLAVQQGCFTWSNVVDIEGYIKSHETEERRFLTKYTLDVRERPRVMRELSLMGMSAVQLMPSVEAVCKKALEDLIGLHPVGTPKGC